MTEFVRPRRPKTVRRFLPILLYRAQYYSFGHRAACRFLVNCVHLSTSTCALGLAAARLARVYSETSMAAAVSCDDDEAHSSQIARQVKRDTLFVALTSRQQPATPMLPQTRNGTGGRAAD